MYTPHIEAFIDGFNHAEQCGQIDDNPYIPASRFPVNESWFNAELDSPEFRDIMRGEWRKGFVFYGNEAKE